MRTLHVGPEELLVAAKVAVTNTDTADQIADAINLAELAARQAVPDLTLLLYIEPDIDHSSDRPAPRTRAGTPRSTRGGRPGCDGRPRRRRRSLPG